MTEHALPLTTFYVGWDAYQRNLVEIIAPLSPEQLALPTALHHWSIGRVVEHILGARVFWFQTWMGEGNPALSPIASWGQEDRPVGSAAELVVNLEATWQMIAEALARWTAADLGDPVSIPLSLSAEEWQKTPGYTRQWIIWHVLEHEFHHGGELSLALGAYGLKAIYD
ncbi:MAG: DinB family protein [Gemmatimonadaceae bacterium]